MTEPQYQVHQAERKQEPDKLFIHCRWGAERRLYESNRQTTFFSPDTPEKTPAGFSSNTCKRVEPLLTPLSSSPPKTARCSSTVLANTCLETSSKCQLQHRPPRHWLATYLMMVMNCVMVSSSGTRNLVLSKRGRYFSLWYLSTITCFN